MFVKHIMAAATCVAMSSSVWASSEVSASINNFMVAVDAGSFNWVLDGGSTQLSVGSTDYTLLIPTWSPSSYESAGWSNSGSADTPLATLQIDTANTVMPVVSYATAGSSGTSLSVFASTPDSGGNSGGVETWQGSFVLGKSSKVTFAWEERLTGLNTGDDLQPQLLLGRASHGLASIDVKIGSTMHSNTTLEGLSDYDFSTGQDEGFVFSSEGAMHKLVVSNLKGASDEVFTFSAMVRVATTDYANAVPEPKSYAMAAAGLGTLALMGRRRRRRAQAS